MTMTMERFAQICEAYGSNPQAWPAGERAAAQALVASSADARSLLERAAGLDERLAVLPSLMPSASLRARVLTSRVEPIEPSWLAGLRELLSWRPAVPALALALVAGIAVGLWMSAEPTDQLDVVNVASFHNDFEDY